MNREDLKQIMSVYASASCFCFQRKHVYCVFFLFFGQILDQMQLNESKNYFGSQIHLMEYKFSSWERQLSVFILNITSKLDLGKILIKHRLFFIIDLILLVKVWMPQISSWSYFGIPWWFLWFIRIIAGRN